MKRLKSVLILLLVCAWTQTASAQASDSWVSVPLEGEQLAVQMPKSRESEIRDLSFAEFKLDGHVYTATDDGVDYAFWSLVDKGEAMENLPPYVDYLDYCADLVWESLLKPRRDQLPEEARPKSRMSYANALTWTGFERNKVWQQPRGREYSIMLGSRLGRTQFYVAGRQIYIMVLLSENANSFAGPAAQRFVNSFRAKEDADPKLYPVGTGGGIGPGPGGNMGGSDRILPGGAPSTAASGSTDYNKVFSGKDVTQKARIISKPEPTYTESARKYSVQGTVVIRAVFSQSGEVTQIRVVRELPHGLTLRAIKAASAIKFTPAQKDGHDVSMWFQLEYNFNLY